MKKEEKEITLQILKNKLQEMENELKFYNSAKAMVGDIPTTKLNLPPIKEIGFTKEHIVLLKNAINEIERS